VPALAKARTAVMAPKTMPTHEALTKALKRTQIPSEQIARLSNFTSRPPEILLLIPMAAPAGYVSIQILYIDTLGIIAIMN
jgi:hypothetical protein